MRKNKWGTCAAGDAVLLIQIILGWGFMCIVRYNETSKKTVKNPNVSVFSV